MMELNNANEIKEYARELCRKHICNHPSEIRERNEYIIGLLQKEFNLDYDTAKWYFENNNS